MLCNKTEHSLTHSSYQANKRHLHTHAKPPSSHPRLNISSTVTSLHTAKSKSLGNFNLDGMSPIQLSYQNKVPFPSPTTCQTLSSNQCPTPSPIPSRILLTIVHQSELWFPPSWSRPLPHHNFLYSLSN